MANEANNTSSSLKRSLKEKLKAWLEEKWEKWMEEVRSWDAP